MVHEALPFDRIQLTTLITDIQYIVHQTNAAYDAPDLGGLDKLTIQTVFVHAAAGIPKKDSIIVNIRPGCAPG